MFFQNPFDWYLPFMVGNLTKCPIYLCCIIHNCIGSSTVHRQIIQAIQSIVKETKKVTKRCKRALTYCSEIKRSNLYLTEEGQFNHFFRAWWAFRKKLVTNLRMKYTVTDLLHIVSAHLPASVVGTGPASTQPERQVDPWRGPPSSDIAPASS